MVSMESLGNYILEIIVCQELETLVDFSGWTKEICPIIRKVFPWQASVSHQTGDTQLVVSSEQSLKWTLFVQKQVKTQTYNLSFTGFCGLPLLIVKGPAKSMPVHKNSGNGREQSADSWIP